MNNLKLISAIGEFKTFIKEIILLYMAVDGLNGYSVWSCRYNRGKQLVETKRFTVADEDKMLEYLNSKGVSKEAFMKVYESKIIPYFHTYDFLRSNFRLCSEICDGDKNTLVFSDGSSITECAECIIG